MEETFLELLLIRHGESRQNRDGTGGYDSDLTEVGVEQARRLVPWLATFQFTAVYTSPLRRSRQTAEIAAAHLGLPVQVKDELHETTFHLGSVLPKFDDPAGALGGDGLLIQELPPNYREFESQVVHAVRDIIRTSPRGTILIFTHGGVIATLLRSIFGAHRVSVYADNGSGLLLRWRDARWHLVFSNRVGIA